MARDEKGREVMETDDGADRDSWNAARSPTDTSDFQKTNDVSTSAYTHKTMISQTLRTPMINSRLNTYV